MTDFIVMAETTVAAEILDVARRTLTLESAFFARQISLALTIKRRQVAAQRQTTIGVRWAGLGLADAFGVYFRWRPFKGNLGAQSTLRKSRSRQWLRAGEKGHKLDASVLCLNLPPGKYPSNSRRRLGLFHPILKSLACVIDF